jgi:hypothetical protein
VSALISRANGRTFYRIPFRAGVVSSFVMGVALGGLPACTTQQGTQLLNGLPADANCALAIVQDFTAVPNIAGTLASCSIAIDGLIAVLASKMTAVDGDAGGVGLSPEMVAYKGHLAAWMSAAQAYKAAQAGH